MRVDSVQSALPEEEPLSFLAEFALFLRESKKWWLIPLVVMFTFLSGLIALSVNPAIAPFIYTLW